MGYAVALGAVVLPPANLPAIAVVWKTNPFAGKFNPGTKIGSSIFIEKTKGLKEELQLDLTKSNIG